MHFSIRKRNVLSLEPRTSVPNHVTFVNLAMLKPITTTTTTITCMITPWNRLFLRN